MIPLLTAVATLFVEVLGALQRAGDDARAQDEALMSAAERLAELRERAKFGATDGSNGR